MRVGKRSELIGNRPELVGNGSELIGSGSERVGNDREVIGKRIYLYDRLQSLNAAVHKNRELDVIAERAVDVDPTEKPDELAVGCRVV